MKVKFLQKEKVYSVYYRQINENEPLNASGIRTLIMDTISKNEDINIAKQEINKNLLNIEVYEITSE